MGKGPKAPANTLSNQGGLADAFGGLAKTFSGIASSAIDPAKNFYSSLLAGGKQAQNVVAPSAMNISDVYQGQKSSIQNFMPAGGERNLALTNLGNQKARSIADLYTNVQPMAAQNLASLGMGVGGLGSSYGSNANSGYGNNIQYQAGQNAAKGQALGGIGAGVGGLAGTFLGGAKPWIFKA